MSYLRKAPVIIVILIGLFACERNTLHQINIVTSEEFSIYPRPAASVVTEDGLVGFYNRNFSNYLFFSLSDGMPALKIEFSDFPLKEMYDKIKEVWGDRYALTPFDTLMKNEKEYYRRVYSEGLFKSENNEYFTFLRIPFEYVDETFLLEGEYVKANVRRSEYFMVFFNDDFSVGNHYFIDTNWLTEKFNISLHLSYGVIYQQDRLIAPSIMRTAHFLDAQKEGTIPAQIILHKQGDEFVFQKLVYAEDEKWFNYFGEQTVFFDAHYCHVESTYYVGLGNTIRQVDPFTGMISDEVLFQDDACKTLSYISYKNGVFSYLCGDLIFTDPDDFYIMEVKDSNGLVVADINPAFTRFPFYDDKHLYFFETNEDFSQTILKRYRLK